MKTKLLSLALFGLLIQMPLFAQDRTTVSASSNEISDNLDLRAVASIFGDAKNLEDFERQLNDPKNQISNLDLNYDRQVDYLRVIEAVEKNTHLIILQAVLEKDVFQDVATIEVERDRNNNVQIQVVGDVFMYGPNYIYEPVYVSSPIIYTHFWVNNYHPYHSPYYFNYYPTYYYAWTPYPVYRYRRNVHVHINQYNYYNYSNHRRSTNAVALYQTRRSNGYERKYPNQSFSTRNTVANRYELENSRNTGRRVATNSTRNNANTTASVRNNSATNNVRSTTPTSGTRATTATNPVRGTTTSNTVRTTTPSSTVRTTSANNERNTNTSSSTRNNAQQQPTQISQQSSQSTRSSSQVKTTPSSTTRNSGSTTTRTSGTTGSRNYTRS